MNPLRFLVLQLIRLYRGLLSPLKRVLLGPGAACRFEPSCSTYALEAISTHGLGRGSALTVRRLCRCHPWGGLGLDPVPPTVNRTGTLPRAH